MRRLALSLFFLLLSAAAIAAPHFPALTGRVVDEAHILSARTIYALDQKLAAYEQGTTNQVVVVTLASLRDSSIEDYGNQLLRYWGIGQKDKNNGVLLIVAPKEHKVRIEAGYGLEPVLTDAQTSRILTGIIEPAFKAGDMERGVVDGTQAILGVLGGESMPVAPPQGEPSGAQTFLAILFMIFFFSFAIRHPFLAALLLSNSRFGGSSLGNSDWGGGGGFSGGGGSSGGGGASGSW